MTSLEPFGQNSILEKAGARVTLTSLTIDNPDVSYETLEELVSFVGTLHRASSWWVGDALNAVEQRYSDKVYQAASLLDLAPQSIMNIMSICKGIPRSRRRQNVRFSTHAEVVALPPEDQTKWLREVEENNWTKAELRQALKGDLPPAVEVSCTCPVCGDQHTHPVE